MGAVVEEHVRGELTNTHPWIRLPARITVAHLLEKWAGRPHLRMTIHANLRGRDSGVGCFVDRVMAVVTIHAHVARVELMAVGHWLYGLIAGPQYCWMGYVSKDGDSRDRAERSHDTADSNILVNNLWEESRH